MKVMTEEPKIKTLAGNNVERSINNTGTRKRSPKPVVKAKDEIIATTNNNIEAQEASDIHYPAYEEAIEKSLKVREMAEQDALTAYKKTIDKAGRDYREAMKCALRDCKQTTEKARRELWGISGKENNLPYYRRVYSGFVKTTMNSLNWIKVWGKKGLTSAKSYLLKAKSFRWRPLHHLRLNEEQTIK